MNIGFDAKRANSNGTGLGNYSRFIVESLCESYPDSNYLLYVPKYKQNAQFEDIVSQHNSTEVKLPRRGFWRGLLSSLWRIGPIRGDIRRDGVEIFHGLSNEIPYGIAKSGARSVVTIHDLIFLRYPQFYKPIDRWIYRKKFSYACRRADLIIAVSECTKRDIVEYFGVEPSRVVVVYQGCDPMFVERYTPQELCGVREKYNLPSRFILNVGSIESRKNLMLGVQALEYVDSSLHLVACGRHTLYADEVMAYAKERGLEHRVHLLHKTEYRDLAKIYQCAEVFIYPSLFEGFGIPIIEALSSGIPTVATTGSCLEEAGGDAALYVEPTDYRALATQITRLIEDKELRQYAIERGMKYVKRFSKPSIAQEIMHYYKELLKVE